MDYEKILWEKYGKTTLNVEELSEELSITPRMIMNRVYECSAEIPPSIRIGRKTVFPIREVAKFLERVVKVA